MEKKERILENLLKPEAEFSPIPFWFFKHISTASPHNSEKIGKGVSYPKLVTPY